MSSDTFGKRFAMLVEARLFVSFCEVLVLRGLECVWVSFT